MHESATQANTGPYDPWRPGIARVPGAIAHPTPLVQSAAMAAVPHPVPTCRPMLPERVVADGLLSDAQLESIVLAGEAHDRHLAADYRIGAGWETVQRCPEDDGDDGDDGDTAGPADVTDDGEVLSAPVRFRRGWMLGDGTGAGKGRQVAAIMLDHWLRGRRRALWLSQSDKLVEDARRDWCALGGRDDDVIPLGKFRQGAEIPMAEGILFATYATLRSPARQGKASRLDQIVAWLAGSLDEDDRHAFDGAVIFDEAHAMANAAGSKGNRGEVKPSQQGRAGLRLQNALPDARIAYVSATGATTVPGLAYAGRLGLWAAGETPFETRVEFVTAMEAGGVAAMEVVARDLKALGLYQARALSYDGVEVEILEHPLTPEQRRIYDAYAGAFKVIHRNIEEALKATGIVDGEDTLNRNAKSAALSAFEGAKQRFFGHLLTAMKCPSLIRAIEADLASGRSSVIQLVSTGEALMERRIAEIPASEWDDLSVDLTPRETVIEFLAHAFPVQLQEPFTDESGNLFSRPVFDGDGNPVLCQEAVARRDALIEKLAALPPVPSALDQIVQHFGHEAVAEVTGRSRRVLRIADARGERLALRSRPASANLAETAAFMDARKRILVFSMAGGTGRSYHADLSCANTERRIHYLLEPGWRADQAIQGLGLEDISQSLFDAAVVSVQHADADYPSRLAIAKEAMVRGQPGVAVDALDGRVALDCDSEELRLLAHAYVLDVPIRERAIRFFAALHVDIKHLAIFLKLEGILHFNRGVPEAAANTLAKALNADCRIDTLMCLIRALYQSDRKDEIRELLKSEEVEALDGTALDRINVSHALLDFSDSERALRHAYTSLSEDLGNAEIVMKFIGLVLRATSAGWEPEKEPKVESGTWVRLVHGSKDSFEALVGEAQDRPWGQAVPTDNAFISQCLELRKGDEFTIKTSLGSKETWRVSEIKPGWLQAFHHLTRDFGQRFPEAKGFAAVTIADDDIEPALEQIRRHSAMVREQADFYLRNNIPLVMASGDRPGGAVAFAQYVSSLGEQVRVCTGAAQERDRALELIRENECRGAVIDAFTAWHAAALGVLPVLTERLGQIAIPANELNRLEAMREQWVGGDNEESMSMDYRDGEYVGFVETAADRRRRLAHVNELIAAVECSCEVEPLQFPDRFSELGEKLVRLPPNGAFAAAVMAGSSRLVVCEDFVMRRLAREGFGANGVWIQAVLFDAEQAGTMSFIAYADAVVYLAHFRHSYVSVSAPVLLSVFDRDISRDLFQLEILCSFVGDKNAEMQSHAAIVAEFINTIWANARPLIVADEFPVDSKTRKGTNLVIRALLEERREEDWASWAAALYRGLGTVPRRYLLRWCEDKFLPVAQLLNALRQDMD